MTATRKPGIPLLVALSLWAAGPLGGADRQDAVEAKQGVVVSVSAPASEVGLEVLRKGGNAVDAAVATAFALAVTWPAAGNIGGGGYLLVYPGQGGEPLVIDFRERAPAAASREMFVAPRDRTAYRRVGVPGTVRGLALAHQRFGSRPWKELLAPAIHLARAGFALNHVTAASLNRVLQTSTAAEHAELRRVFARPGGGAWQAGDRLVQKDLAHSLELIAEGGPGAFYTGELAGLFAAEMKRGGGLITRDDLAGYQARAVAPIHGTYRGYDVYSVPPSSSGGICLVEMLNILENFDLRRQGRWAPETLHQMIEAMRRAYCDRARYLADPAFVTIPAFLTSKAYARKLAAGIDPAKATPSGDLARDLPLQDEGEHTTHLSVIDRTGTAVSLTYTLEDLYGSRIVVKGAGFLLNDEMNDFNWLPGVTNRSGRIGTKPNLAAPGKRMLSSQTPTVVAREGKVVLVTGSPGGRTIINTVLCVVVNVLDFGMDARSAVDAPRMHHQWFPDEVHLEPEFAEKHGGALKRLQEMGYTIGLPARQGDAHSILVNPRTGTFVGAADHRISGSAAGY